MKKNIKSVFLITLTALITMLSGCATQKAEINWYSYPEEFKYINSRVVAENSNFKLSWDSENAAVVLIDKKTGIEYSNIPANAKDNTSNPQVYSPVNVSYVESESLNIKTVDAKNTAVKDKSFNTEIIENGIKVTYFFQKIAVSVPVYYELRDDSLKVSVKPSEITEDTNKVYNITLLPFFCAVNNKSSAEDNYLFVPSGSGALVYPKVIGKGITSQISSPIYGQDFQTIGYSDTETENVYLPVYGAKNGDNAVCAIIENASETAVVETNIGSEDYAYSSVYSSFNIRGAQVSTAKFMGDQQSSKTLFCQGKTLDTIEIGFYPLNSGDSDYNGMAKCYQKYLTKTHNLAPDNNDTLLNVKIYGGITERKYFMGIPYEGLDVLTDFEEVLEISDRLSKEYDGNININLLGFGKTGLNIGKIAGGLDYGSGFGNINVLKKVNSKTNIFFNFDILRFSEGGAGIVKFSGISRDAIGGKTVWKDTSINFSGPIDKDKGYYYVRRDKLEKIASTIKKKTADWSIDGISFDTLTKYTYSDYSNSLYYAKSGFIKQTESILNSFKNGDKKIAATGSNFYAAILADQIFDAPTSSSKYQVYDKDVPFYSMVFKGYRSVATKPINSDANPRLAFLKAVETGNGLNFALVSNFSQNAVASNNNIFYSYLFEDNLSYIAESISEYESLFESVKNVKIEEHCTTEAGLQKTTYENGISVYVNYTDKEILQDGVTVAAFDFEVKEEG